MKRIQILIFSSLLLGTGSAMLFTSACSQQEDQKKVADDVAKKQAQADADLAKARADAEAKRIDAARAASNPPPTATESGPTGGTASPPANLPPGSSQEWADAKAQYDVAVTKAEGNYKVAKEKCEALPAAQQSACRDVAKADYEKAKAQAEAERDRHKR